MYVPDRVDCGTTGVLQLESQSSGDIPGASFLRVVGWLIRIYA